MNTIVDSILIEENLNKIFTDRFDINQNFWEEDKTNAHLLSTTVGFVPRDLVYLLYDVEKEFNIKINDEDIVSGKFSSFNNIKDIILKQLALS